MRIDMIREGFSKRVEVLHSAISNLDSRFVKPVIIRYAPVNGPFLVYGERVNMEAKPRALDWVLEAFVPSGIGGGIAVQDKDSLYHRIRRERGLKD